MSKLVNGLGRLYIAVNFISIIVVLTLLSFGSLITTVFFKLNLYEEVEYHKVPWKYYIFIIILIVLLAICSELFKKVRPSILFLVLSVLSFLIGGGLIVLSDFNLRADPASIMLAAKQFNSGDYSALTELGGYLFVHPHQLGLLTINRFILSFTDNLEVFSWIFLIISIANIGLIGMTANKIWETRQITNTALLLAALFLPNIFYIKFIYNGHIAVFLALLSIVYYLNYWKEPKFLQFLLMVFFLSLSVLVRSNFMIFQIAITMSLFYRYLLTKEKVILVIIPIIFLASSSLVCLQNLYYENEIGQPLNKGLPKITFVTMGMSSDPDGVENWIPGYHNAYHTRLYQKTGYDENATSKIAIADLKKRISYFLSNPKNAYQYFTKKFAATWFDGTFESIWVGPIKAKGMSAKSSILADVYSGGNYYVSLVNAMSVLQIFTYCTLFIGFIIELTTREEMFIGETLPMLLFLVGTVVFHLFWETKSQYTYTTLLILQPLLAGYFFRFIGFIKKVFRL